MKQAIAETKMKAVEEFSDSIDQLADYFGGQLGGVLSSFAKAMNDVTGSVQGKSGIGLAMKQLGLGDVFGDTMKDWFSKDSDLGQMFTGLKGSFNKLFGSNGTLVKNLGKTLGAAGAGAQVGQTVAVFGKMLSSKFSTTGSTVGGAIGGAAFGPIGAIAGSILGGVVGGLFKKAKWGTSTISMSDGELSVGSTRGNKGSYKANSSTAAGSIISGIEAIAEALGGTISGSPNISIGQYKGKWRVSNTGRTGKLKGNYSDVTDFGKDGAEEAVAYAISESLKQGILTGVSAFTQRVLKTMDDTDKAVTLAQSYEAILDSLASYKNPIKGAVDEVITSIDTLAEQMKKAGATSEELANVEEYRAIKLQQVLENQVSGFQSFLDDLNGTASGKSTLTLLNEQMAKMEEFRTTLASGGTIDQDKFTSLGQSIMEYASELYGTQTSSYQSIRKDLIALSESALGNATSAFNSASSTGNTYTAINDNTEQVTASISTTNDLLAQILASISVNGIFSAQTAAALKAANGALISFA